MVHWLVYYAFFLIAACPFIYYLIAIYSTCHFFRISSKQNAGVPNFTPPVSILKPVRGLDPDAYENFASFCRQDYPDHEIVFCVGDGADPVLPVIEKVTHDFPECKVRVLFGSGRVATNDKDDWNGPGRCFGRERRKPVTHCHRQTHSKRRGLTREGTHSLLFELRQWVATHGGGHGFTPNATQTAVTFA